MGICSKIPYRFWIGLILFFTTYMTYMTRSNQSMSITAMVRRKESQAVPECIRDQGGNQTASANTTAPAQENVYDWDQTIQGRILGAYFYGFFVGCFPAVFVPKWLGPFWTIFIATLVTGVMNSTCAFAADIHYGALMACRLVMGFMGAFIYPSLHVLVACWAPPAEKGKFVGAMMGNNLGTFVTWYLVGEVTSAINWQWGYHVLTIKVAVFLVIFWFVCSDSPEQNKWISQEEIDFIKASHEGRLSKSKSVPPYMKIVLSLPVWALIVAEVGNLWGLYLQITGVPKFLVEVLGFNLRESGILAALPQLARLFLGLFFGFIGDWVVKKGLMSKTVVRKSFICFSHFIPGTLILVLAVTGCDPVAAIVLLTFSMGFNGACTATHLQNNQDLSPNFAGTLYATHALIGCITGFICPEVTGQLIKENNGIKEWGINFVIGACFYIAAGIFFIIFGSTEVQSWNEKKEDA